MSPRAMALATLCTALGAGLVSGVFLAFSTFVMAALARLPTAHGVAAMQAINVTVLDARFMAVFFGTAVACVALAVTSLTNVEAPGARWRIAGAALYLVGTIGVTVTCNVPRNDALAALQPESAAAATYWPRYVVAWATWNHVRGFAALAAAAALTLAMVERARRPG